MTALRALQAIPFGAARQPDLWLLALVAGLLGALVFAVPAPLLDGLLALNLSFSVLLLAAVLLADRALALSTFPSVLLLATLFRLVLNVSTTRMILSTGRASAVVTAFGEFVVAGNVVVGLVSFGVITLIQLVVIAKGAERVAEVGARFTLDALPGRQMSIDAAARAGTITEAEAQRQRDGLARESQFYGAMDGAMKFVKGDAVAGLIITALNLGAGFAVGMLDLEMSAREAGRTFTLLTVGDGLVSQVPALVVTLSAGILTTRVGSGKPATLGASLQSELLGQSKVLAVAAGFSALLGLLPGFPTAVFWILAAAFALSAWRRQFFLQKASAAPEAQTVQAERRLKQVRAQRSPADHMVNVVAPIGADLGPTLAAAIGCRPGADDDNELVGELLPELREVLFGELGVRFPSVRIRTGVASLSDGECVIRVKDVPVARANIHPSRRLVAEEAEVLRGLGIDAEPTPHPWGHRGAALIHPDREPVVKELGHVVWTPAGQVALHLARVMRTRASSFVGLHETAEMLQRLERAYPSVIKEAVPKIVTVPQLAEILRRLVDEQISIKDLRTILETLVSTGDRTLDPVARTELVRAALGDQIAFAHAPGRHLPAVLLEPVVEDMLADAIVHGPAGSYVALEPALRTSLLRALGRTLAPALAAGQRPVLLTRVEIRRYLRKLIEVDLPDVAVLSFRELPARLIVQPLGRVDLPDDDASG